MSGIETVIIEDEITEAEASAIAHLEIAAISFDAETEEEAGRQFAVETEAQNQRWEDQADWAATSF